jgi:ion channel-forming bestrophin family protein
MIVREKKNWFHMLFIWEGSVLVKIYPRLIVLGMMSALVVYFQDTFFSYKIPLNSAPFTLMGGDSESLDHAVPFTDEQHSH